MIADFIATSYMQAYMRRVMNLQSGAVSDNWSPPRVEQSAPTLLYLHVPFCEDLCSFCSFNTVKLTNGDSGGYFQMLRSEMRAYADLGYRFDSIYVGGGTPTIMPDELEATLRLASDLWKIEQISAETNPNHLTPDILSRLRDLGIDRLSVGVQSFNDDVLREIGRYERYGSGELIQERLAIARTYVDTLNVDLIFAYPMQTEEMLLGDLRTVKKVNADQITYYPLMSAVAQKEHAGRMYRAREYSFYQLIHRELAGEYPPSSAWCFSRTGESPDKASELIDEYIVQYSDYAGLGSGSFGYLGGTLYSNTFNIREYAERLGDGTLPIVARQQFSTFEQIRYDFLMKLFGGSLSLEYLRRKYGRFALLRAWKEVLFFFLVGAVRIRDDELVLTGKGYYLWLVLMREFFTGVNIFRERAMTAIDSSDAEPVARRPA